MAAPVYRTAGTPVIGNSASPVTGAEPSSAVSGDFIFGLFLAGGGGVTTCGVPSGWTAQKSGSTANFVWILGWIIRGASAPSYAFTHDGTASTYRELYTWRADGTHATAPVDVESTVGTGTSVAANSPSLAGKIDTLAITVAVHWSGQGAGGATVPTGYTRISRTTSGDDGWAAVKTLTTTATEDPAAWGNVASSTWIAYTFTVKAPGGAALSGSAAGTGATTGSLKVVALISGVSAVTATASAQLRAPRLISGTSAGTGTATGTLTAGTPISVRDFAGQPDHDVSGGDLIEVGQPPLFGQAAGNTYTIVSVVKRDTTNSWDAFFGLSGPGGPDMVVEFSDDGRAEHVGGSNSHSYEIVYGWGRTDWLLVAVSVKVATSSGQGVRFHVFDGTTWFHGDRYPSAGTDPLPINNWFSSGMKVRFGQWNDDFNFFDGKMAAHALWRTAYLSDTQIEALAGGDRNDWAAAGADHLWELNQPSISRPVLDYIGSCDQTLIRGTAAVTGQAPPSSIYDFATPTGITVDQANAGTAIPSGGTGSTTISVTTTAAIAPGARVIVFAGQADRTISITGVSGGGLTWTVDKQQTNAAAIFNFSAICSAHAPSGLASGTTITVTFSGTTFERLMGVMSLLGVHTTTPIDTTAGNENGTDNASWSSGNVSIAAGSCLITGAYSETSNGSTPSSGNETLELVNGDTYTLAAHYQIRRLAGSYANSGTFGVAHKWAVASVAYKAAVPPVTGGDFAQVQKQSGAVSAGSTSFSRTFSATPTVGNLLIACASSDFKLTMANSGWTLAAHAILGSAAYQWYKIAGASEPTTITVNAGGSASICLTIFEYSGNAPVGTVDVGVSTDNAGVATDVSTGTTATTRGTKDLAIALVSSEGTTAATITGWTNSFTGESALRATGGLAANGHFTASKILSASGTVETTAQGLVTTGTARSSLLVTYSVTSVSAGSGNVAYRSSSGNSYASRANTTLTPPAGIVDGDLLLLYVITGAGGADVAITPPPGFAALTSFGAPYLVTKAGFNVRHYVYWKIASGESGNYALTHTTISFQAWIGCYSGVDPTNPVGTLTQNNGTGTITVANGLTATRAGDLILFVSQDWGDFGLNLTAPSGFTERFDTPILYFADQALSLAGAVDNRSITNNSAGANAWAGILLALQPPAAGGPGPASLSGSAAGTGATTGTTTAGGGTTSVGKDLVTPWKIAVSGGADLVLPWTIQTPPAGILPLDPSTATATATLALRAPATLPLAASTAAATGTLTLGTAVILPLGASAAAATGTLAITFPAPVLPMAPSVAVATGTLALTGPTRLPMVASAATATGTLALTGVTSVPLNASTAQATASLTLRAPPAFAMSATATASGTLNVLGGAFTFIPLNPSTAQATGSLGFRPRLALVSAAHASGTLVVISVSPLDIHVRLKVVVTEQIPVIGVMITETQLSLRMNDPGNQPVNLRANDPGVQPVPRCNIDERPFILAVDERPYAVHVNETLDLHADVTIPPNYHVEVEE